MYVKKKLALVVLSLSVMCCLPAYANDGVATLEQLQQQTQETQVVVENTEIVIEDTYSGESAIANIAGAAKMDTNSETVSRIGYVMNSWAAKLMQLIGYVIAIGLGLVTALDACYIAVPPLQSMLANGYTGKASSSGGAGGPLMLGPQAAAGGPQGQVGLGPNMQMNNQQQNRMRLVSQEALDAVEDGKNGSNPFKVYFKKRWLTCVMAPVLFVLAATGVLSQFGFMLGEVISQWIGAVAL